MASAVLEERQGRISAFQRASAVLTATAAAVKRAVRPHTAPLVNLAKMPLTVTGLGCIDAGVFTASDVAGWIVTGISLIVLEYAIADET